MSLVGLTASSAAAQATVNLIAAPFTKTVTLPNGTAIGVPMWGFALDANMDGVLDPGEDVTSPGPRIAVPPGTGILTVYLTNRLSSSCAADSPKVSLVVLGQDYAAAPQMVGGRVVSLTHETACDATGIYTFGSATRPLKPGTFLYESGSHQAVQVQMGLYGAVTMDDTAAGTAYAGVPYAHEALLVYSEIDLALHQAVADGTYGHPELGGPTSTIDYKPSLYLINGESYPGATLLIDAGVTGEQTLIRLLNAGLKTHAPVLDNGLFEVVAEDGNPYPFSRTQAALMLAAGKTHDAIWTPTRAADYGIFDRMLALNAAGQAEGGMHARLRVTSAVADTIDAVDDMGVTAEDNPLVGASVLTNDSTTGADALTAELVAGTGSGMLVLNGDGTFSYTPDPDFSGFDSFTYVATDGTNTSLPATVSITVTPVADQPVADAQEVGLDELSSLPVTLVGTDPDGDALTFTITQLPTAGTGSLSYIDPTTSGEIAIAAVPFLLPSDVVIYTAASGPSASFQFEVSDGALVSAAAATVTATVHPLPTDAGCGPACAELAVQVVDTSGAPVTNYRWTLEEDRTYNVIPDLAPPDPNTLAVSFHASYMPVVQAGVSPELPIADPARRYFLSVLSTDGGYSIGGASVAAGQGAVTVTVTTHNNPIPTARIRVRVFHDNAPLNGVWDPTELGLQGFVVTLEDAGGRYGMSAGDQMTDAFGNMIGTTYQPCPTGPGTCESYEVDTQGQGFVLSDADGWAVVNNLVPGKYGVKVRAPGGATWQQTSTIEGTRVIDAWVKANEPNYFTEFGPPGPHAEVGFVQEYVDAAVIGAGAGPFSTISGQVVNLHMSRPPDPTFYNGAPFDFTKPWVALNTGAVGGTLIWAGPTDDEGNFSIAGVPSGSYQIWIFDSALNIIIASKVVNVSAPTEVALNEVPVFQWFTRTYNYVFEDLNENGFRDDGEAGLPEQAVNIRWRDGTMYQSAPTDLTGFVPFEQVFPFFAWQVAEVDYARLKATGVTVVVDNGGDPNADMGWPGLVGAELDPNILAPQPQAENGGGASRTEIGPVLLEAFQGFIGQSSVFLWGKAYYAESGSVVTDVNVAPFDDFPGPGDTDEANPGVFDVDVYHGGVSGIVHYSTTRAENDPRWGFGEPWEPGVPLVRVQLWDKSRTHLLNEVETDSWDDNLPTECQGPPFVFLGVPTDCYDGLRVWNQVRPGVFDGGYAFYTMLQDSGTEATFDLPLDERGAEVPLPAGEYVVKVVVPSGYQIVKEQDKNVDFGDEFIPQAFWLTGYPLADAGPADAPGQPTTQNTNVATPFCVGTLQDVPAELALFPGVGGAYGGEQRPLCDAKLVSVRDGANAAANFFVFTEAPIAGHISGFVLDDTQNEFDPNSPQFGEKFAPPFLPVSIHDWTGLEITRTFTDAFGRYNVLVPSTYTAAAPQPSGMSPNMLTACINAAMMPGPGGTFVPDPHHNKNYSQFCYTLQYMPGTTTYLDTPVVPTAAFAAGDIFPVDAELPTLTPAVQSVTGLFLPVGQNGRTAAVIGPYIVDNGNAGVLPNNANHRNARLLRTIRITSAGMVDVPNPYYRGPEGGVEKFVTRDYGFGTNGGIVRLDGQPMNVPSASDLTFLPGAPASAWSDAEVYVNVPSGADYRTGQLTIERCLSGPPAGNACPGESRTSVLGVTLSVATSLMHNQKPPIVLAAGAPIQSAIDAAEAGDLILVPPGTYSEMVVMSKPVRLQGWGAMSTTINAVQVPQEKVQAWRDRVGGLLIANPAYLLPEQVNILPAPPFLDGDIAAALGGEHPPVLVLAQDQNFNRNNGNCQGSFQNPNNEAYCQHNENQGGGAGNQVRRPNSRIDGFTLSGSSNEAGVFANAFAHYLQVSNNRIFNNYGNFAGGVRIGHPDTNAPSLLTEDADNINVTIRHNLITQNAGLAGGGGVALGTGSNNYAVSDNFITGNFSMGWGAGVTHLGLSPGGVIDNNVVTFNETFNQGLPRSGAGIFVGGPPPALGALTLGSGSVQISNNLVQGNQAGAGDGGGIALVGVNGQDILDFASGPAQLLRYSVRMYNNIVVNNVSGLAGGGISLQDAAYVEIVHNTIAHNDSLAVAGAAFVTDPNTSDAQPAGIVSRGHTPLLAAALGGGAPAYADPILANNILWENRSFFFGPVPAGTECGIVPPAGVQAYCVQPNPAGPYWDLEVLGAPAGATLNPQYSVLTDTTGYAATNSSVPPAFVASYFNDARDPSFTGAENTTGTGIIVPAAFDEGGNFIRPQFGPLTGYAPDGTTLFGAYHVSSGVTGQSLTLLYGGFGNIPAPLVFDIDGEPRPLLTPPDRGADQVAGGGLADLLRWLLWSWLF